MRPKGERDRNTSHHDRQLKSKSSAIINFTLPGVLFHMTTPCLYPAVIHAWGIQGKNCNLKAWGKNWNPPGALLGTGECCVERGRASQTPGWEAKCQIWACPGALQRGCDSCAPHELGVGTGDTSMAPSGVEELLFPAVHPKFSVHICIYI